MLIKIQKLWPANAKYTSFKGEDGRDYKGEADLYEKITEGMTIDPPSAKPSEWTDQKGNSRTTYWLPKGFDPNTVGHIIPQPAPQHLNGPSNASPAPPRQNGNGSSPFRTPSEMFVSEIVASAMRSGKFDTQDIKLLALAAVETWKEVESRLH